MNSWFSLIVAAGLAFCTFATSPLAGAAESGLPCPVPAFPAAATVSEIGMAPAGVGTVERRAVCRRHRVELSSQAKPALPPTHVEERRTVLTFEVPEADLRRVLPSGWRSDPAKEGQHQGANLFVVLADRQIDRGTGDTSVGNGLAAVWLAPARNGARTGFVVLGGYVEPDAAPGYYGVYRPANLTMRRESDPDGLVREEWQVIGKDGGDLRIRLTYQEQPGQSDKASTHTYSARDPAVQGLYTYEQKTAPLLGRGVPVNRVRSFEFQIKGGPLAQLIRDPRDVVSLTSIPRSAIAARYPQR
jgi:hypothetical protein